MSPRHTATSRGWYALKHVLLACQLLFGHVSIQNEINMHARERANVAALLTLRVDVLSARSDGSKDAMHHLVCVVE